MAGFALGIFISQLLPTGQTANFIRTSAILVVLLLFLVCQLTHFSKLNQVWHCLLSFSAGLLWAKDPNTSVIININVVNTDLLLNIAAAVFALLLTLFTAALQAVILLLFFAKVYRLRKAIAEAESDPINKRKKLALRRDSGRVCGWLLAVIVIVLAGQLYWDQVASRPPKLSKAELVTLSADGNIHIPTEQFKDNKLHRFAWHTEEG